MEPEDFNVYNTIGMDLSFEIFIYFVSTVCKCVHFLGMYCVTWWCLHKLNWKLLRAMQVDLGKTISIFSSIFILFSSTLFFSLYQIPYCTFPFEGIEPFTIHNK